MIGVLALQGDFEAHVDALRRAGVAAKEVRSADEILESRGLVLPGGESTTFRKLMDGTGIEDAILTVARRGDPVLGTCAGAILLARDVEGPPSQGLGLLPMTVVRNAYGRQLDSSIVRLTDVAPGALGEEPARGGFYPRSEDRRGRSVRRGARPARRRSRARAQGQRHGHHVPSGADGRPPRHRPLSLRAGGRVRKLPP